LRAQWSASGYETWQSSLTQGGFAMFLSACRHDSVIRRAPMWGCLLVLSALLAQPAAADPGHDSAPTPDHFDRLACYQLVRKEGRMNAWARWEQGYSLEKARAGQFAQGTPVWVVDLVRAWIADAYSWQVTDEQVHQWAAELGNTSDLPSANGLSRHETIAIWMRRIARQCASQDV
jgi:hypothetical protein